MVGTSKMFESCSWEETTRAVQYPTTKWVDRVKKVKNSTRRQLVARGCTPRHEGFRDDVYAAMPSLEAKKFSLSLAPHGSVFLRGFVNRSCESLVHRSLGSVCHVSLLCQRLRI